MEKDLSKCVSRIIERVGETEEKTDLCTDSKNLCSYQKHIFYKGEHRFRCDYVLENKSILKRP